MFFKYWTYATQWPLELHQAIVENSLSDKEVVYATDAIPLLSDTQMAQTLLLKQMKSDIDDVVSSAIFGLRVLFVTTNVVFTQDVKLQLISVARTHNNETIKTDAQVCLEQFTFQ